MNSTPFDPNKIRVEDLFRAKEERRERLARLPFEEKIKIVKKLQTGVSAAMKNEKLIFDSFLRALPDFASEPIEEWNVVDDWYSKREVARSPQPFDKHPDIIALTASGKKIGVELKSWVSQDEIAKARKQEKIKDKNSPNEMLEVLSSSLRVHKTDDRYKDLKERLDLDEVYLLVHYDFKAFAYNTAFDAPNFDFEEAAKFASSALGGDGGNFDRVFLFHFLWGKEEACRIF